MVETSQSQEHFSTLGHLLNYVASANGMERILALVFFGDTILKAVETASEGQAIHLDSTKPQGKVILQAYFFEVCRDLKSQDEERLDTLSRVATEEPDILEIPGLEGDLRKLVLAFNPDEVRQALKRMFPRHEAKDVLGNFYLEDETTISSVPPGDRLWLALGVKDQGEWNRLSRAEQWRRFVPLAARDAHRFRKIVARLYDLVDHASDKGGKSVSDWKAVPLESPELVGLEDPLGMRLFEEYDWRQAYEALLARATPAQRVALSVYLAAEENGTTVEDEASKRGIKPQTVRDRMRELKMRDWVGEFNPFKFSEKFLPHTP